MTIEVPAIGAAPNKAPNKNAASTSLDVSLTLSPEQQSCVYNQLTTDLISFPAADLRNRYTLLDLAYYMEAQCSTENQRKDVNYKIQTIYRDLELPVLQPNIDSAHAYLVGVFLSGKPIFGVTADARERTPEAVQMESIIWENSTMTGWGRQLNLFFKNGLKYNIATIDTDWWIRRTFNPITDTNASLTQASVQEIYRGGNELKNHDPYNTFFDISKSPADCHTNGDYAGYVERLTLVQLYDLVLQLQVNGGQVMNIGDALWKSAPKRNWYHVPQILSRNTINSGTNWLAFLSTSLSPMRYNNVQNYEVVHYQRRIIPAMFKMDVPDKNSVQIWKFIEVNGIVIFAERKSNAHNTLSTVFMQPLEDSLGLQTKGLGENLLNFQNLSGTMFRARMASLARSISDRGIFDPSMISAKDANSTNPSAKIPLRPTAYGKDARLAYHAIPYDDRSAQSLYQDIGQVLNWGQDAAHINRAQRGQFTKGNRTAEEYNDVMDNADSTQQTMAMLIEDQVMVPIKHQVKVNILQYQAATQLPDPNTKAVVEINPAELRKAVLEFNIADGLVSKEKILSTQAQIDFFQIMSQVPEGSTDYDLIGMMANVMESKGAKISQYKRTPAEVQARLQAQNPQAAPGQAPVQA